MNLLALLLAATLPVQPAPESYRVGPRPAGVTVSDLNGDRYLDVAVVTAGDGKVTILLGRARGFAQGGVFSAGNEPADIESSDVDRDGDRDLVIANHETSSFTVLLNDGKAQFTPATGSPFATGARPHIHSVSVADFDGDGFVDVAVESADTNEVRLRRGSGRGFGPVIPIAVHTMPYFQLGAADVTGEGVADILVPGHGDRTVRVVSARRSGFAVAPVKIRTREKPWAVAGLDYDGDGRTDVAVVESDSVSVWLARGDGFRPAPRSPWRVAGATAVAVGKLGGSKADDIVIGPWEGDELTILSSRSVSPRKVRACGRPIGLAVSDVDRDGAVDIVVACATEARVVILRATAAAADSGTNRRR